MLKLLMLRKKLSGLKSEIEEKRFKLNFETREAQLTVALEEAQTDEEIKVVEENINELLTEQETVGKEIDELQGQADALESEIKELESKKPESAKQDEPTENGKRDNGGYKMNTRKKLFGGLTREAFVEKIERSEVKDFLTNVRGAISEKRSVKGAELTIPDVLLDLLRDNLESYSKLAKHVFVKPVKGKARQTVMGTIPEGIWVEATAKLNEISIEFNSIEVDGYKVGGYTAIPNSTLEDSDLNLANEILYALAQSIGLAVDKAILYGTGKKMPVGIVTRLAEDSKQSYYGDKEREWKDLRTSNLLLIDPAATESKAFFADLIVKTGAIKPNYSNGKLFWAMNTKTQRALQAKGITFDSSGTLVSIQNGELPVIGGKVEILEFVPDGVIVGGYGSLYLLVERDGGSFAQSEHAQFIEDNTVFKGTARYDGRPIFGEAFMAIQIFQKGSEAAPKATDVTFAADTAN